MTTPDTLAAAILATASTAAYLSTARAILRRYWNRRPQNRGLDTPKKTN